MKIYLTFVSLIVGFILYGQSSNVFLERSYWKGQPTIEQVRSDIKLGNDPSAFNSHKFDAVTWAIIEEVPNELVWFLLKEKGNDVNKRAHDGRTPIFWAAYRGNIALMKELVKNGAQTDLIDSHGYSLMNFAANTGQLETELYDLCLQEGTEIKAELNNEGATPLLLILPHLESIELISYFTSKGLSLDQLDNKGNNGFVYAARSGNQLVMDFLLGKGMSPIANNSSAVLFASKGMRGKKNGIETFEYLQKHGLDLKAVDEQGQNALHFLATNSKDEAVLSFFLNQGLDLNQPDENGNTPFFNSFENNSAKITSFLLSRQVIQDVIANADGENVIHIAASRGNIEVLKLAIATGTKLDVLSEIGLSPLHIAAMKSKNIEIIEVLLDAGADKNVQTPFEETAFDLAKENKWLTDQKRVQELLN